MNIKEILDRASGLKMAVVGDAIKDRYINGMVDRISPEAPVPVLRITGNRESPGGAGNVVENLKGLGCDVDFYFDISNVIEKTRIMSGSHHLLRIDDEESPRWMKWRDVDQALAVGIKSQYYNCVVISDYGKGMISPDVAKNLIELGRMNGIPVVVDTKSQQSIFVGSTVVKCNMPEWKKFMDKNIRTTEWNYLKIGDIDSLVVTDGANGMYYWNTYGPDENGHAPGIKSEICDPCGAGDTVISVLAIMSALGEPIDQACELANIAASEVCKHPGVYAIKKEDLLKM